MDEPELPWLRALAHEFNDERASSEQTPFALLELYARGSVLATNLLSDSCWRLNEKLFNTLPDLLEATSRKKAIANSKEPEGSTDGRWNVLGRYYFKSQIESAQTPLKTDLWMRRRLESAFSAWVDSHLATMTEAALPTVNPTTLSVTATPAPRLVADGTPAPGAKGVSAAAQEGAATTKGPSANAIAKGTSTTATLSAVGSSGMPANDETKTRPARAAHEDDRNDPSLLFHPAVAQYLEPAPTMLQSDSHKHAANDGRVERTWVFPSQVQTTLPGTDRLMPEIRVRSLCEK